MKLTPQHKRARALVLLFLIVFGSFKAGEFKATHHQEEKNCHTTPEGRECSLVWVRNS